jgi:hypothetical protein
MLTIEGFIKFRGTISGVDNLNTFHKYEIKEVWQLSKEYRFELLHNNGSTFTVRLNRVPTPFDKYELISNNGVDNPEYEGNRYWCNIRDIKDINRFKEIVFKLL